MATGASELFKNRTFQVLFGVVGLLVVVLGWQLVRARLNAPPSMSPVEVTRDRLMRLSSATSAFVAAEQRLPGTIEEGAGTESTKDGWGRSFTLTPGTEGSKRLSFVIRSSGADGVEGNADDQTSTVRFGNDGYGKLGVESGEMSPEANGPGGGTTPN